MADVETIRSIAQDWFLSGDAALFAAFCTHSLRRNDTQTVPLRCGQKVVEYNPALLAPLDHAEVKRLLKNEMLRILLKHPYHRRPNPFVPELAVHASNLAIGAADAEPAGYEKNMSFEQYYYLLLKRNPLSSSETKNQSDGSDGAAGLWQEDELICEQINTLITDLINGGGKSWGTLSGSLKESICATLKIRIDYRKVLKNFRASVVCDRRRLTRLKPNRRTGFDYMGSTYDFTTKLLVAVDTSGSISSENLNEFLSAINRLFKYGIKEIEMIYFDCALHGEPQKFSKAQKEYKVTGRGGTSFQPVFDFINKRRYYDGVIIFTDGYAPEPVSQTNRSRVAWVCNTKQEWEKHHGWMQKTGRTCYLEK